MQKSKKMTISRRSGAKAGRKGLAQRKMAGRGAHKAAPGMARKLAGRKAHAQKKAAPGSAAHGAKRIAPGRDRHGSAALEKVDPVIVAYEAERIKEAERIISNSLFAEFIMKSVGRQGVSVVKSLNTSPRTDEKLAVMMDMKVNEMRRMLNVLNGYGITRYDINKDGKGWLTFKWHLDREKLAVFNNALMERQKSQRVHLQEGCNDFFYCEVCYKNQKTILPFDSAFELNFKCEGCGKILQVLNREQASMLFRDGSIS